MGQFPVNSWRKWFCFPLASNCHPHVKFKTYIAILSGEVGCNGTTYQTRSFAINNFWRSRVQWYCVPNTLFRHNNFLEKSGVMVLRTKHAPSPSITFWRSRLVWSRARDWKSRNRQKRFKSSNLFFSATKIALGRVLFVLSREIRRHLCRRQHCCRTLRCTLRFACKHAHFAVGRISSSPPPKCNPTQPVGLLFSFPRNCAGTSSREKGKSKYAKHVRLHLVAGDLRSKEMFVAKQRLTSSSPPIKTDK